MMKILVVQESDWITRGPHQQHQLFDRLSVRGHEIRVIDYDIDWNKKPGCLIPSRQVFGHVHKIDDRAKITVIRPSMIRLPIINYISMFFTHSKEICNQIVEFNPDVIVAFGIINASIAQIAASKRNIPFVYYWIDILHMLIPARMMQLFGKLVEEDTLMKSDKVVVINKSMKEYVIEHGAKSAEIIGAGVDLKSFKPKNLSIREQYGVEQDELLLFFMGYVYSFSGLIEVAKELANHKKVKLMVVGDGESFKGLEIVKHERNLGNKLILVDKRPYSEMPDYINAADVCILPADVNEPIMQDIVPIKLYEYMAMGKPIICTELKGIVQEFGYENGIAYVNNAKDVVRKSRDIDYTELRRQSLAYMQDMDWEKITDKFEKLLIDMLVTQIRG